MANENHDLIDRLRMKTARIRGGTEEGVFQETESSKKKKPAEQQVVEESIALLRLRPVMTIKNDKLALEFVDDEDKQTWKKRLEKRVAAINRVIPSVGRIELTGGRMPWVGTGWIVEDGILVTNRHVALEFARRGGDKFSFLAGIDVDTMSAHSDFDQEIGTKRKPVRFELLRPLWIEESPGPDIAFFEIQRKSGSTKLAAPLTLSKSPAITADAATIGYPAYDSRIPAPVHMHRIFQNTYDKKRFAPGGVVGVTETRVEHDCTTLGGNSGSVLIDLASGEVIGLHFSGTYLDRNYAVRSDVVRQVLDDAKKRKFKPRVAVEAMASRALSSPRSVQVHADAADGHGRSIPVTVTLTIGDAAPVAQWLSRPRAGNEEQEVDGDEAKPEDYRDRKGYNEAFLVDAKGKPVTVALPDVMRDSDDVLSFKEGNQTETALKYQHFSVVMSESRRMCFLSATNIDGNLAKKAARVGWKWDPRIPKKQQIMAECYGSTPKFSRGHMTRREDPGWGTAKTSKRGNEDSMHVTNACPQMQAFNAPIWLKLEDYALQHAKEDKMKISVFTGPYFDAKDPTMYGVRIPVAFWKVIAFIHDDTGKLCATGYEMTQEQSLQPAEEFVYGQFFSPHLNIATQVPIAAIELRSGISFGDLIPVDPLNTGGGEESPGAAGPRIPLSALEDIRFV